MGKTGCPYILAVIFNIYIRNPIEMCHNLLARDINLSITVMCAVTHNPPVNYIFHRTQKML